MDERLIFNKTDGVEELALNWAFLAKIWVPDTFFVNGKKSYLHKITVRSENAQYVKTFSYNFILIEISNRSFTSR